MKPPRLRPSRTDAPPTPDGYGQSLVDELRSVVRFRRRPVEWRLPTDREASGWEAHPVVGRFGDATYAVAEVDGRRWVVRDRVWFGWPDPPEFVWFVLDGEAVWAACDFNDCPRRWARPEASVER